MFSLPANQVPLFWAGLEMNAWTPRYEVMIDSWAIKGEWEDLTLFALFRLAAFVTWSWVSRGGIREPWKQKPYLSAIVSLTAVLAQPPCKRVRQEGRDKLMGRWESIRSWLYLVPFLSDCVYWNEAQRWYLTIEEESPGGLSRVVVYKATSLHGHW